MKSVEIERIGIMAGAGFGLYYGLKNGKNLFYFIILLWIAWGLMVATSFDGPIIIPDGLFEKKEDPKVVGYLKP